MDKHSTGQEVVVRLNEHKDLSTITLLIQSNKGGLQVKHKATGTWLNVPNIDNMLLMNTGDVMQMWSNGIFPSTEHRVIIPNDDTDRAATQPRYSLVFFCTPNWDTSLKPLVPIPTMHSEYDSKKFGMFGDLVPY